MNIILFKNGFKGIKTKDTLFIIINQILSIKFA